MTLIALYYVCSIGIYYNVYIASKTNKTIRNGQSDVTVKYTEQGNSPCSDIGLVQTDCQWDELPT
jgi:hypothetical protein